MTLKKHHKWAIGGSGFVVVAFMITTAIILNGIIVQQQINHNALLDEIEQLKLSQDQSQSQISGLTDSLIETKESITTLDESFQAEVDDLKASVSEDFSGIIEDSIESVVTVRTDKSQGTGFIINDEGYFVTNAHVIVNAEEITALTSDQGEENAILLGYDETSDVALLKISGSYSYLELADSNDVSVGERVVAIGNPLGLQFSVSQGIVSAVHRVGPNGLDIYIQTDTPLNPGNSGGPLINREGKVIGINNFKVSSGESLGFALESNYIKAVANEISQQSINRTLIE